MARSSTIRSLSRWREVGISTIRAMLEWALLGGLYTAVISDEDRVSFIVTSYTTRRAHRRREECCVDVYGHAWLRGENRKRTRSPHVPL